MEELTLRVFENNVLNRIFRPRREEMTMLEKATQV
jgi:hypothetical protein